MKLFITGASGFLGKNLLARFSKSHQCVALIRKQESSSSAKILGVEVVTGDLEGLTPEMMNGCDIVIHTAALAKPFGKRVDFTKANVDGTRRVVDCARKAGVKRLIHISTEAVCFKGRDLVGIDESAPILDYPRYDYAFSKAQAEKIVRAANIAGTFETIVLRPSWIWGPGDTNALTMMVTMVKSGKFMWVDHGRARKTTTFIHNLIDAIECAFKNGTPGEFYFINDAEYRPLKQFLVPMLETQGVIAPEKSVPGWLIRIVGSLAERWWKLSGQKGKPAGTRMEADFMASEIVISCEKAKRELDWKPLISIDQGLKTLKSG